MLQSWSFRECGVLLHYAVLSHFFVLQIWKKNILPDPVFPKTGRIIDIYRSTLICIPILVIVVVIVATFCLVASSLLQMFVKVVNYLRILNRTYYSIHGSLIVLISLLWGNLVSVKFFWLISLCAIVCLLFPLNKVCIAELDSRTELTTIHYLGVF